jgi:phosphoenolpyruvate synthase/pyruvate phosphate dikinase
MALACTVSETPTGQSSLAEGDMISLDGETGAIYQGRLKVGKEKPSDELGTIAAWRQRVRSCPTSVVS